MNIFNIQKFNINMGGRLQEFADFSWRLYKGVSKDGNVDIHTEEQ